MLKAMRIDKPGLYPNMSAEVYHQDPWITPSLSSSLAKELLNRSPLHAWVASQRLNPDYEREDKGAFDLGTACHTLLMGDGPTIARLEFADRRTKAYKEAEAAARAEGKTPLLAADHDNALTMMDAVEAQLEMCGRPNAYNRDAVDAVECSAFAVVDGTPCRARADALIYPKDGRPGVIRDFKTIGGASADASPAACSKRIANLHYDLQAQHYVRTFEAAWEAHSGQPAKFVFELGLYETSNPYLGSFGELADEWADAAEERMAMARKRWNLCVETNTWPGYPATAVIFEPPVWHIRRAREEVEFARGHEARLGQDLVEAGVRFQAPLPAAE